MGVCYGRAGRVDKAGRVKTGYGCGVGIFLSPAAANPQQPEQTDPRAIELLDKRGLLPNLKRKPLKRRAKEEDNID